MHYIENLNWWKGSSFNSLTATKMKSRFIRPIVRYQVSHQKFLVRYLDEQRRVYSYVKGGLGFYLDSRIMFSKHLFLEI